MNKIKNLIFDFDGTIANTLDYCVNQIHYFTEKKKLNLTKKQIKYLIQTKGFKQLIKKYKLNFITTLFMIYKLRQNLKKEIHNVKQYPEIIPEIKKLKKKGFTIGLLTANKEFNVKPFLVEHDLNIFEHYKYKTNPLDKASEIRKYLKKHNLKSNETLYIGDELTDIEACKKAGLKILCVTYGFNNKKLLLTAEPEFIVDSPKEILGVIKSMR